MNVILTYLLYLLLSLGVLAFVDPKIINIQFLSLPRYIVIIGSFLFIMLYAYKKSIKVKSNLFTNLIFIMLAIIIIPGSIFSADNATSLFRGILAFSIFGIIFGVIGIIGAKNVLVHLYKFLLITSFIVVILTDIMLLIGNEKSFHMGNLKSFFLNANMFGTLVGLYLLPTLLLKIFQSKNTGKFYVYLLFFINLLILFWFIRSRSALLSFLVFSIFIFYYKSLKLNKNRIRNFMMVLLLLSTVGVFMLKSEKTQDYLEVYFTKYEHLQNQNDYSILSTRSALWAERIHGISKRPLIGWGYGINAMDYDKEYNSQLEHGKTEKGNTPLAILEEFGLFFGLLLIVVIGFIVASLFKKIHTYNIKDIDILLITSSILLAALIHVNFESWLLYFGNPNAFLFWFFLVTIITYPTNKNPKEPIK